MAEKTDKKAEKAAKKAERRKNGTLARIKQIYAFTAETDKNLPWILIGSFLAPVLVFAIICLVARVGVVGWIMWMITGVMGGLLAATWMLTRRADMVGYRRMEGRPGATGAVLSQITRGGFYFPQEPIWIDPRTKDAIWRGSGRTGVYLVGEGDYHRVMRAIDREENKIKSITRGSAIPIYKFSVGDGPAQIKLRDLQKKVMRQKVKLTKAELDELNNRLRTLQEHKGYGIPKGIDPTRPQRVSRRAMRGR
ncbi:DUF4191 domain-containing protein [Bifidobacterium vespertilionis]|uniref:DUF4191 domain-containing protein n=1 Tax=Bifidobacterium vespertilionis TaxID=2562524 RepID=A0A5J5E5H8_9BIFI|nr:DUF4191 domain-containing protein [Bifidobacterium vespertilionis]KAA8822462.1 DUF4191 domain-containing protein [Bifidobacterium vespertilionis]KAA8824476.1 DUF4191 domain-containing protein [Bifidobacterium vespertilionis]